MPNAKNQRPTTTNDKHHPRYRALRVLAGKLISMAAMQRAAHNLYLDTLDSRQRVLAKYRGRGIYLYEGELVRKLLYVEFYRDELTIVNKSNDYSIAG
jgi:hypothetical protein